MASAESLKSSGTARGEVGGGGRLEDIMDSEKIEENGSEKTVTVLDQTKKKKNKKKRRSSFLPKFGCLRSDGDGRFDMESASAGTVRSPTHLVVTVNGIIGSAQNWRFAAKQFLKQYPRDVVVHCSECNYGHLTFHGVDVMGNRLADEVISVVRRYPDLVKISFIGHSLGGLVARYAIAKLYGKVITQKPSQENGESRSNGPKDPAPEEKFKGQIAGLEPVNFITSATPHLGSRGHKQAPVLCGFYNLEKAASSASWMLGRTGKHLFLRDGAKEKPPLLLQMVNDSDNLPFISALGSFRRRVAYANARFDHLVGWSTSSLRHRSELPKRQNLTRSEKYPHIINVEPAKSAHAQDGTSVETKGNRSKTADMEEAMLRGLTKVSWERVDVDFRGTAQRFLAHSTIQVKTYWLNSDGTDVIQHMVDNFLL
ncbi:putative lipase ROG1 [Diospyros lotus]|uniref:putative lipase ROG1 n=1 Tax=Diospyros lotus TaxID=55363 RepID=UPI00224EE9E5|nr:putative lipase ROG1 [Diospyros lotus]